MAFMTEVINIAKIKEGFYIGDEITASNLDAVIKFKITHMINAAGSEIINAWESIGIKYLTLNWPDNPNKTLFDSKDEIANRIVCFIEDSFNKGEGLLAHSVHGQNRVCIVVIIYLIKKYKWALNKCIEFLRSKKRVVMIPDYFLNQIILFEKRLIQNGEETKAIPWTVDNIRDPDESLLRNTYVNGLLTVSPINKDKDKGIKKEMDQGGKKRIEWLDNKNINQNLVEHMNPYLDLINLKEIKPITSHLMLTPNKSNMKNKSTMDNVLNNNDTERIMINMNIQNNINTNNNCEMLTKNEDTGYNLSELLINHSKIESHKEPYHIFTNNIPSLNVHIQTNALENNRKMIEKQSSIYTPVDQKLNKQFHCDINTNVSKDNGPHKRALSFSIGDTINNKKKTIIYLESNRRESYPLSSSNLKGNFNLVKELFSNNALDSNNKALSSNIIQINKLEEISTQNMTPKYNSCNSINKKDNSKPIMFLSSNYKSNLLIPPTETVDLNISYNENDSSNSIETKEVMTNEDILVQAKNPKPNCSEHIQNKSKLSGSIGSNNNINTNTAPISTSIPNKKHKNKIDINTINNQSKQIPNPSSVTSSNQIKPLNNFNPALIKKNNTTPGGTFHERSNPNTNRGPIKINKPKTPDPIHSISTTPGVMSKKTNQSNNNESNKISSKGNSTSMTRPVTSPQKDKQENNNVINAITTKSSVIYLNQNPSPNTTTNINLNNNNTLSNKKITPKRLPTPQLQSTNLARSGKSKS